MPVEEKKDESLTGPPIYVSGLTTRRNPYGGKTNPAELCKYLEQAKQPPKNQFNE